VTELCQKMNDPDFDVWVEDTNYTGRALSVLIESLDDIIALYATYVEMVNLGKPPKDQIPYEERDFHGLIDRQAITVGLTAIYDIQANIENCYRVLEVYPYPDLTNTVDKILRQTTEGYFKDTGDANWLEDEEVMYFFSGDNVIFFPMNSFSSSSITSLFYAKYIKNTGLSAEGTTVKDIDLLDYFSTKVVNDAMAATFQKLIVEEQRGD